MIEIQNTQECFVQLWLRLERTRRLLGAQHKRFCIRSVLKSWFGLRATDDFIWEVCHLCEQEGWSELPLPSLYPRKHREFLRAIVAVTTGISFYRVNLKALDAAYSIAFPGSTPINVNKKSNFKIQNLPAVEPAHARQCLNKFIIALAQSQPSKLKFQKYGTKRNKK